MLSIVLLSTVLPVPTLPTALEPTSPVLNWAAQSYSLDTQRPTHSDFYFGFGVQTVTTRSSDGPDEEIDFNEGYAVPVLIGKRFDVSDNENLGFAVELEGIYTDQEADNEGFLTAVNDVTGISILLNGVIDYSFSERVGVYGGAGVGMSWLDIGTENDGLNSFDDEDGPFLSWQLKAGVLFQASDTVGIDVGYRFLNIDDAELDNTNGNAQFDLETRQHMVGLGLRFDI